MGRKAPAADNKKGPGEVGKLPYESNRDKNDDVNAQEVKYAVKELVENEMATIVQKALDDILRRTVHDAQSGILSVLYSIFKLVMMEEIRKDDLERR